MKESEILYAAAESMRKEGYQHNHGLWQGCGCFADHIQRVTYDDDLKAWERVHKIVGSFLTEDLERDGWNKDDAIAALTIAADCAFEDEKQQ